MNKEINEKIKIFFDELKNNYNENSNYFKDVIDKNKKNPLYCPEFIIISEWIIYSIILFFIISIIWLIYDVIRIVYIYTYYKTYYIFKDNKRLLDDPLFHQINDFIYYNDYISYDINLFWFIITIIFLLIKIQIFETISDKKDNFRMLKYFCYLSIILLIIYYLVNYKQIIRLGKAINISNRIIYNNINVDFINSQKICNYLYKKNEMDYKFVYGKCNDVDDNIGINKLYDYIKTIIDDIEFNIAPINNIDINKFKTLTDKNGKLYKDKIISALFTYQLLKYFIDNDLIEEAKDFFSAFNIIYSPNIYLLRKKINPLIFLRDNNILVFDNIYEYNSKMKYALNNNKNIYNYLYAEYTKRQNIIQDIVVEIFNICKYKFFSVYNYYFGIFIIFIILLIFYYYYLKK